MAGNDDEEPTRNVDAESASGAQRLISINDAVFEEPSASRSSGHSRSHHITSIPYKSQLFKPGQPNAAVFKESKDKSSKRMRNAKSCNNAAGPRSPAPATGHEFSKSVSVALPERKSNLAEMRDMSSSTIVSPSAQSPIIPKIMSQSQGNDSTQSNRRKSLGHDRSGNMKKPSLGILLSSQSFSMSCQNIARGRGGVPTFNKRAEAESEMLLSASCDIFQTLDPSSADIRKRKGSGVGKSIADFVLPDRQLSAAVRYGTAYLFGVRLCMCLCALIECFGEAMIVPYFPRAMEQSMTLNLQNTSNSTTSIHVEYGSDKFGFLLSITALAKLTASIFTGLYICELGAKNCMVYSFLLNAIGMLALGFNPLLELSNEASSLLLSYVCFVAIGFSSGAYITASYAIILDTFPETFSREIGFYEIFSGLASGVAPLLAGLVLQYYDDNFLWVGVIGAILGLACFICALLFLKPLEDCEPSKITEALFLLKTGSVQLAFMAVLLGMGVMYALEPILEDHVEQFIGKTEALKAGLPWAVNGIAYALFAPMWGNASTEQPRKMLLLGTGLMMVTVFLFDGRWFLTLINADGNTGSFIYLCVVAGLVGALLAAPVIASYQEMNDAAMGELRLEPNLANRGLVSTCWNIGYSLSNVIGPTIFGYLGSKLDFYWTMRIYGFCLAGLLVPMTIYYKRHPRAQYDQKDVIISSPTTEAEEVTFTEQLDD